VIEKQQSKRSNALKDFLNKSDIAALHDDELGTIEETMNTFKERTLTGG
jgi:hypothetical protein